MCRCELSITIENSMFETRTSLISFLAKFCSIANNTVRGAVGSGKRLAGQRPQYHSYKKTIFLVLCTEQPTGSCRIPIEKTIENYYSTAYNIPFGEA